MATITINNNEYEADLLVFDKDGLMFDSEQFWIEMANARIRALSKYCSKEITLVWTKLMGVCADITGDTVTATWVDPVGILAIAPPTEEVVILAAFLVEKLGIIWHEARKLASELFVESDKDISLDKALSPQPGYVELMKRINELGVPYGVATSDTYERTKDSMSRYNCWDNVRFVVTPEDVALGKPEPDMLIYVSHKQNVPLDRMIMIGDSYVDVKMAQAAGSIGIGVSPFADMREKMAPYATEVVESLEMIKID